MACIDFYDVGRFNKMTFLLECLKDIDCQLKLFGGNLNLIEGEPTQVIKELSKHFSIQKVCFDQVYFEN